MEIIKKLIITIFYTICRLMPIQKKIVLFFSYYGEQYSGSPKYLSKYMADNTNLQVIWAFIRPDKHAEAPGKTIKYGRMTYYYYLATAGTIITNYRMTEEFHKRKGQLYIQTWHSSLRLKQIEKDAADTLPAGYLAMAKKDSQQLDILLAGSEKSKEIFERAFWYNGLIANTGTPQCDILFNHDEMIARKVRNYYSIPQNAHIALYAPTFRKNHGTTVYDIDTASLITALEARFGGKWYLLMRLHPHLVNSLDCFEYNEKVLQATNYDDVQELLCATDFLISDYSAIMFDFSVTGKPCVLYTPDLAEYTKNDRRLYFDICELPFEYFERKEELLQAVMDFNVAEYDKRLNSFMESIGSYDDGKACERVCCLIAERV